MFDSCLYFNLSSLTRRVTRIWDEEFKRLGLAPSHGYLLTAMAEHPGLSQKGLGELMDLDASTINRFVEVLVKKGLVEKTGTGKGSTLAVNRAGKREVRRIQKIMVSLMENMSDTLGKERFHNLVGDIHSARGSLS